MVIILVAALFAIFVTVDLIQERRRRRALVAEGQALHEAAHAQDPQWIAGFQLPDRMHYHQGHTWALWVSPDQAYVGVDDFARRLIGKGAKWKVPSVGSWVEQGKGATHAQKNEKDAALASPLTGEVIATNPRLRNGEDDSVHADAFGHGWLYKVRTPDMPEQLKNLLHGRLATRWMEDVRDRFQNELVLATGNVVQDGGHMADDLSESLDSETWSEFVDEFLQSKSQIR